MQHTVRCTALHAFRQGWHGRVCEGGSCLCLDVQAGCWAGRDGVGEGWETVGQEWSGVAGGGGGCILGEWDELGG